MSQIRQIFFVVSILPFFDSTALAAEPVSGTPELLLKYTFATDPQSCVEISETDGLQLDQSGIWGLEFGCKFLDFVADKDPDTGEVNVYVARVNCGDDSGINRPDMITLIFQSDPRKAIVQSQNEFVTSEAVRMSGYVNGSKSETPEELAGYVSREYALCETN